MRIVHSTLLVDNKLHQLGLGLPWGLVFVIGTNIHQSSHGANNTGLRWYAHMRDNARRALKAVLTCK